MQRYCRVSVHRLVLSVVHSRPLNILRVRLPYFVMRADLGKFISACAVRLRQRLILGSMVILDHPTLQKERVLFV